MILQAKTWWFNNLGDHKRIIVLSAMRWGNKSVRIRLPHNNCHAILFLLGDNSSWNGFNFTNYLVIKWYKTKNNNAAKRPPLCPAVLTDRPHLKRWSWATSSSSSITSPHAQWGRTRSPPRTLLCPRGELSIRDVNKCPDQEERSPLTRKGGGGRWKEVEGERAVTQLEGGETEGWRHETRFSP